MFRYVFKKAEYEVHVLLEEQLKRDFLLTPE